MFQRISAIKFLERFPTISEWCESFSEYPCRQPTLCRLKGFKSLNGFQPSFELAVETLDDVGRFGTGNLVPVSCVDVRSEFFCMLEDIIHYCDLDVVILVLWRAPPDTCFESVFAEHRNIEDVLLDVIEE